MSSSNFGSAGTSQNSEVKKILTPEKIASLRERFAALPSPEEMEQKQRQLSDYCRQIIRICESILEEKHS